MAAPTAMHQGRKKRMREARPRPGGSVGARPGGAQGALGGAGVHVIPDADADSASSGLAGADGSVSCVLRLVGERIICYMTCEFAAVSDVCLCNGY
jgi:hypothetical protein